MSDIKISLVASANRVKFWERFCNTLRENTVPFEVIFVGDTPPMSIYKLPPWFKWIKATVKPAQCYQIGFWAAQGELIHWTADDADYYLPDKVTPTGRECFNPLDRAYDYWLDMEKRHGNDKKSVVAFRPIEDGGDVYKFHHFFGGWEETPVMAPFALIHREYFVDKLGGYDKDFVSGQSENDVIMRVFEDGGRVEVCLNAFLYVHHRQVHPRNSVTGKEDNKFREWYPTDRQVLEDAWVVGGHGAYEKLNQFRNNNPELRKKLVKISPTRLKSVNSFENTSDVTSVTQGLPGRWKNA